MKNHTVQARLNELEYMHLDILKRYRNKLQEDEGITYSNSDIIRIALSYMYSIEITNSIETKRNEKAFNHQQEQARIFWENYYKEQND